LKILAVYVKFLNKMLVYAQVLLVAYIFTLYRLRVTVIPFEYTHFILYYHYEYLICVINLTNIVP